MDSSNSDSSTNWINITIWCTTSIGIVIITPLILYFNNSFQKFRKQRHIQIRKPLIVRNIIYCSAIHLCVERPILAAYFTGLIQNEEIMQYIYLMLPCILIIGFLSFMRVWVFYIIVQIRQKNISWMQCSLGSSESRTSTIFSRSTRNTKRISLGYMHLASLNSEKYVVSILLIPTCMYVSIHLTPTDQVIYISTCETKSS